jgi:hypothetical protein
MSTRSKKRYSKADIAEAKKNNKDVRKYFARKSKRRKTVQIRIDKEWHTKIKEIARSENMLMSFMIDSICKHFFKNYQ